MNLEDEVRLNTFIVKTEPESDRFGNLVVGTAARIYASAYAPDRMILEAAELLEERLSDDPVFGALCRAIQSTLNSKWDVIRQHMESFDELLISDDDE